MTASSPTPQWSLYIVRTHYNQLYTGVSTDVARRFAEHQQGGSKGAKALRGKGPLRLEFQQSLPSKQQAMRLEYQIKQLSKAQKEQLILGLLDWRSLL